MFSVVEIMAIQQSMIGAPVLMEIYYGSYLRGILVNSIWLKTKVNASLRGLCDSNKKREKKIATRGFFFVDASRRGRAAISAISGFYN